MSSAYLKLDTRQRLGQDIAVFRESGMPLADGIDRADVCSFGHELISILVGWVEALGDPPIEPILANGGSPKASTHPTNSITFASNNPRSVRLCEAKMGYVLP